MGWGWQSGCTEFLGICYHDGIHVDRDLTQAMKWFHCAAEQGNVAGQGFLASCYAYEEEVRDIPQAIRWYTAAAEQGNPAAQFTLGEYYGKGNDHIVQNFQQAFYWHQLAAASYYPRSLHRMGYHYMWGLGVNRDWKEAVLFFKKAIVKGEEDKDRKIQGEAYCDMGACYKQGGYGIAADSKRAFHYLTLSANLNNSSGQCSLADCYIEGIGVAPDPKKAEKLLRPLIDKGDAQAQCQMGEWYIQGKFGKNKEQDGIALLKLAEKQGFASAQAILGKCYFKGEIVTRDQKEAVRLWHLAAEKRNTLALAHLGSCYIGGKAVDEDKVKGFNYLRLAVQGDAPEPYIFVNLGRCYQHGCGINKNLDEALRCYRLAGDHMGALFKIGQVMEVLGRDKEAYDNYKAAAQKGDPYAQFRMGEFCEGANPPNLAEAEFWYAKSAEQGHEDAKIPLQEVRQALYASRLRNTGSPLAGSQSLLRDSKASNPTPGSGPL